MGKSYQITLFAYCKFRIALHVINFSLSLSLVVFFFLISCGVCFNSFGGGSEKRK